MVLPEHILIVDSFTWTLPEQILITDGFTWTLPEQILITDGFMMAYLNRFWLQMILPE